MSDLQLHILARKPYKKHAGNKTVPTFRDISAVLSQDWGLGSWFWEVQEKIPDTEGAPPNSALTLTREMPVLLHDPLNSHIIAPHLLSSE